MKRHCLSYIVLVSAVLSAVSSCVKTSTEYTTSGTEIHITVDETALSATRIKANFVLDNDKNYYYCEIIPRSTYAIKEDNSKFMQLVLDSVYTAYVNWKYEYLKKDETYIASFSSHCLWYGNDYWEFSGLAPDTEYTLFAFCVNPDTKQPVGDLFYVYVKTPSVKKSSLTFKFYCDCDITKATYTVEPSNDIEPFFADYIDVDHLNEYYQGDLRKYVDEFVHSFDEISEYMGYDVLSSSCYKKSQNLGIPYPKFTKYYMYAFGYDGVVTTDLFYQEFTFEEPEF